MKKNLFVLLVLVLIAAAFICGCTDTGDGGTTTAPTTAVPTTSVQTTGVPETSVPATTMTTTTTTAAGEPQTLLIATTTSLYDTGLLDALKADFEEKYNANVDIISAGTGKALGYGENGDVDVMMVHDRVREDAFLAAGHGIDRRVFAYNFFVILGPPDDPAGIKNMTPEEAFTTIRAKGLTDPDSVKFVSRGDDSGTHAKEKAIWEAAGFNYSTDVQKSGEWYIEAGTGMGATLVMADEKQAYTLSDIGTYLATRDRISLVPLVEEGDILLNVYSVMRINPAKHPGVNATISKEWINYLIEPSTQEMIAEFGVDQYGQPLFYPAAGNWDAIGVNQSEVEDPVT